MTLEHIRRVLRAKWRAGGSAWIAAGGMAPLTPEEKHYRQEYLEGMLEVVAEREARLEEIARG